MMKEKVKTGAAVFAAAVLLLCSEESLAAAQGAVYGFWKNFLPAMLPFFLLAPYLTAPDAQAVFARILGRPLKLLFGIPGGGAGALLCGWIAGSPAGCISCALSRDGAGHGEYARLCALASGLSPAFLITAAGSGALGDAQAGALLFAAHAFALLCTGLLLRGWEPKTRAQALEAKGRREDIFLSALVNLGKVLCWMTVFSVFSALAAQRLPEIVPVWLIAPLCEISSGVSVLARADLAREAKLVLLGAYAGFGGVCVLMQNAQASGLPVRVLIVPKILHAGFGAAGAFLLLHAGKLPVFGEWEDVFGLSCACALALCAIAALWRAAGAKNRVDAGACRPYTDTKAL